MRHKEIIDFYKPRDFTDKLLTAAAFLFQNRKVIYLKSIFIAIPVILILGYLLKDYISLIHIFSHNTSAPFEQQNIYLLIRVGIFFLFSGISILFFMGYIAAVMFHYKNYELFNRKLSDISLNQTLSFTKKTWLVDMALSIPLIIVAGLTYLFIYFSPNTMIEILIMTQLSALFLIIFPPLSLSFFPVYFEGKRVYKSIREGFSLGIRYWDSTSGIFITSILISLFIQLLFTIPFYICLKQNASHFSCFIFGSLSVFSLFLTFPFIFISLAFQYLGMKKTKTGLYLKEFEDM